MGGGGNRATLGPGVADEQGHGGRYELTTSLAPFNDTRRGRGLINVDLCLMSCEHALREHTPSGMLLYHSAPFDNFL